MNNIENIKKITMQIAQGLKKDNIKIGNSKLLNYISEANGYKNWSAYSKKLEEEELIELGNYHE